MADEPTGAEDVMRGVAGGAILGVPLLYTRETWIHGRSVSPVVVMAGLVVVLGLNVALSYFVGFRLGRAQRPVEDAVVGMGLSAWSPSWRSRSVSASRLGVFAVNIAPTEEPVLLAAELDGVRLGLLVVASLVLPYLMVFYAEFGGRDRRVASGGATQGPLTETLLAYAVAFAVSAAMLAMFGCLGA